MVKRKYASGNLENGLELTDLADAKKRKKQEQIEYLGREETTFRNRLGELDNQTARISLYFRVLGIRDAQYPTATIAVPFKSVNDKDESLQKVRTCPRPQKIGIDFYKPNRKRKN